jgi:hypothetical protein
MQIIFCIVKLFSNQVLALIIIITKIITKLFSNQVLALIIIITKIPLNILNIRTHRLSLSIFCVSTRNEVTIEAPYSD